MSSNPNETFWGVEFDRINLLWRNAKRGSLAELIVDGNEIPFEQGEVVGPAAATAEAIAAAEHRLGRDLPPSYRSFLAISDGFPALSPISLVLWGYERIAEFKVASPEWASILAVGPPFWPAPPEELRALIQIGPDSGGSVLLLNPVVTDATGEFEAWWLQSHSLRKFSSFREAFGYMTLPENWS